MTTLRHQIELESIFLITIVAGLSFFFVFHNNQRQFNLSGLPITSPLVPTPTSVPNQNIFSQISPDGKKKVVMNVTNNTDGTRTYSFSTEDSSGENKKVVFSKTLDSTKGMSIPFNTWSTDDQYFFIQENSKEGNSIFVFKASGEAFSDTEKYFDVTDLFKKRNTGNNFKEATGWASSTLIVMNTTKDDGSRGSSYWFEVPSKAIIQLSTQF